MGGRKALIRFRLLNTHGGVCLCVIHTYCYARFGRALPATCAWAASGFTSLSDVLYPLCLSSAGHCAIRNSGEVSVEESVFLCLDVQAEHLLGRSRVYYFYLLTFKGELRTIYQKAVENLVIV